MTRVPVSTCDPTTPSDQPYEQRLMECSVTDMIKYENHWSMPGEKRISVERISIFTEKPFADICFTDCNFGTLSF